MRLKDYKQFLLARRSHKTQKRFSQIQVFACNHKEMPLDSQMEAENQFPSRLLCFKIFFFASKDQLKIGLGVEKNNLISDQLHETKKREMKILKMIYRHLL